MIENTNARDAFGEDTLRNVDTPKKLESEVAEHISREKAEVWKVCGWYYSYLFW